MEVNMKILERTKDYEQEHNRQGSLWRITRSYLFNKHLDLLKGDRERGEGSISIEISHATLSFSTRLNAKRTSRITKDVIIRFESSRSCFNDGESLFGYEYGRILNHST